MSDKILKDFKKISNVSDELINKYKTKLPEELIMIWQKYGFGTFYNGYLKIINPEDYKNIFQNSYFLGDVSIPVFATAFGDLITWEKNQFVGIVKYRYSNNDVISDGFEFFIDDVTNGEFDEGFFNIHNYNEAVKKYGHLEYDECFGYVPLLALGGKESVDNLKKVKIHEHIVLITEIAGKI
ncbi:MAG: DUF1851 domain-containing protein [Oscillospiraceae bacterium]|nr:DUF1851 domain-containing protein [Oscillospiraceae bacterium]